MQTVYITINNNNTNIYICTYVYNIQCIYYIHRLNVSDLFMYKIYKLYIVHIMCSNIYTVDYYAYYCKCVLLKSKYTFLIRTQF